MSQIIFNAKKNKFEGFVNGKVLVRAATEAKAKSLLKSKHGIDASIAGSVPASVKKSEFTVKERFDFIGQFTKLAAKGVIPGLVVTGSGGLGKTHTVLDTLSGMGLKEDTIGEVDGDYVFIKGYTTPRNLYTTLYHNNVKVIVFDDCDSSFKDPIGANIFKAALDSYERRIISWGAESKDDEVPSRFEFNGKVIFISNMSIEKFPQAILSRSMLVDLTLNLEEKVERIESIFNTEKTFDKEDKVEVMAFIKNNMNKFKDLNIRSAMNTLKMKVAIGEGWERMALYSATIN